MADLLAYGEDIIGFPGGEATAKVKLMKLLWENSSPTSTSFAAQRITLSSDDYDMLMYVFKVSGNALTRCCSEITVKGRGTTLSIAEFTTGAASNRTRVVSYVSDTSFDVGIGRINGTEDNAQIIPYQIYGIKLEQEIPVVAENVSTLAANCLLSDGETSVEDKIGNIYRVEKDISNKSISTAWGSMFIGYETVDISGLGLNNAPDVVSVTFGTTEERIALCAAASINKNNIGVSLIRAQSGTVNGKIIVTLKSNG